MDKTSLRNREIINDFLVNMFYQIIDIENAYMKHHGIGDLSVTELKLLDIASSLKRPAMTDIANRVHLTNGTITSAIKKLEKKGYAHRVQDANDKRIYRVKLTDNGTKAVKYHVAFFDEMVDAVCNHEELGSDKMLIGTLSRLSVFFDSMKEEVS